MIKYMLYSRMEQIFQICFDKAANKDALFLCKREKNGAKLTGFI